MSQYRQTFISKQALDPDLLRSLKRTRLALTVSFALHGIALGLLGWLFFR